MDTKFQEVTLIISCDDLGGGHSYSPIDNLYEVVRKSSGDVNIVTKIGKVKNLGFKVIEEENECG
jgi:hypothetical protein|tara:strand:+ start:1141 stop:1335 length:195 start_codon:yes stop_codon:yes gene_type:complete